MGAKPDNVFMYHRNVFFFNGTATTEIYTLSLHDALPISRLAADAPAPEPGVADRQSHAHRKPRPAAPARSEEHTSELQSLAYLVCRLLLEKKNRTRSPRREGRCQHRRGRCCRLRRADQAQ